MQSCNATNLKTTKAETLSFLSAKGYNVPLSYYFSVKEWNNSSDEVLSKLALHFKDCDLLAVRSSSQSEDTENSSMAGAFLSILNVRNNHAELSTAIDKVVKSFGVHKINEDDQILVQKMVQDVVMSGVVMSKVLDDGSPYYVINFDDSSGKTDSITSGSAINKTVYVYNGVKDGDFDSPRLHNVVKLVRSLENIFVNLPLDIEFAIDKNELLHLLQVRRICSTSNWNKNTINALSEQIEYVREYITRLMQPRHDLYGAKTILGVMPDWNPAEMIGIVPRPLAASLYREIITKDVWCIARKMMGYRQMPNTDLMVSVSGHSYIDVRCSFNSFLPDGLVSDISEKLMNAWIDRLAENPHLHDKVEFEVVHTILDFNFLKTFKERYDGLLSDEELAQYQGALRILTSKAIREFPYTTLDQAEHSIQRLVDIQKKLSQNYGSDTFGTADLINAMLHECKIYGTIPFAVAARHAFIAETLLRSAIIRGAISEERVNEFKKSVHTITKEMSVDFYNVYSGKMSKNDFLDRYGHLRPSTYDILSPCYRNRETLFDGVPLEITEMPDFIPTKEEINGINLLFKESGYANIEITNLLEYAKKAIKGREYGKFIFTKHLSFILESIAHWGQNFGLNREQMSLLPIEHITNITYTSLPKNAKEYICEIIKRSKQEYDLAQSFKLSYLIRSERDVYVVPQQRTAPNFISRKSIESQIKFLSPDMDANIELAGFIVCIEGADPGYDWIFSRNIAGLVTKFGGANSHMAIRCAEYDLPAAIGCGEQTFERIVKAGACVLNCAEKKLLPTNMGSIY